MKNYFFILIMLLSNCGLSLQSKDLKLNDTFTQAVTFQESGEYEKALSTYKALDSLNIQSEELFYNIGSCYFNLEKWGYARAYYEKAIKLSPRDKEVVNNLNVTLKKIEKSNFIYFDPTSNPVNYFTQIGWLNFVFLFIILLVVFYFLISFINNEFLKTGAFICSLVIVVSLIFSFIGYISYFTEEKSVIIVNEAAGYKNPLITSKVLKTFSEGQRVFFIEQLDDWFLVKEEGSAFWVKGENIIEL